ncbi:hypothetical protein ACIQXD_33255 [Streptomyces uncialis]|uniref:hypothetical protein n=1 Tax=Streptomyces uncialis TaxID=1048205 RepID=UPI003802F77B
MTPALPRVDAVAALRSATSGRTVPESAREPGIPETAVLATPHLDLHTALSAQEPRT